MRLVEWVKSQPRGEISRIMRRAEVGSSTIVRHLRTGRPIVHYDTAQKISEATGGAVSIAELCEPQPKPEAAE